MSLWRKLLWRRNHANTRWHWRDSKGSIKVIDKVSNEKSTKKSTKELIEESDEEVIKVIDRVSNNEPNNELQIGMIKISLMKY